MLRSQFVRGLGAIMLGVAVAPVRIALAAGPHDTPVDPSKNGTPEERMNRRYPQPVKIGFLVGLPLLDQQLSTLGFIREVVRADGKILLVVPYRAWLGWAATDWGRKDVAVPIEAVVILGRQVAALEFSRDDFAAAPPYTAAGVALHADETIKIAVYRR